MAYLFLLHVGGALALLLWAIHMVQSGIDRGWRPEITAALRWASGTVRPAGIGLVFAVALQSATATGMLAAGFAAKGALTASAGLAIMLGADLGSALVVYFLSLNVQILAPLLLIVGTALFFKTETRKLRQTGRGLAGIGLIFVAFALLGEATSPLRESTFLPAVVAYLGNDVATAVIAGAAIAWLLHSSVAAIVLLVTLTMHGVVPIEAAASLLIGANVGGAMIPFVLTRGGAIVSRQIVSGNLILRGGAAVIALVILSLGSRDFLPGASDAARLVNLHLTFNAALLLAGLPLVRAVAALMTRLIRRPSAAEAGELALGLPPSCLDSSSLGEPAMALGNTHRELIRMAEIVARMFEPIMDIYRTGDPRRSSKPGPWKRQSTGLRVRSSSILRASASQRPTRRSRGTTLQQSRSISNMSATPLPRRCCGWPRRGASSGSPSPPTGWRELSELHQSVVGSMRLAQNVLVTRDVAQARQLVQRKSEVRALVDDSMRRHMQRLKEGTAASVSTSNIHLETIRALKTINSLVATIGYHVLAETGEVLDSRLKPAG